MTQTGASIFCSFASLKMRKAMSSCTIQTAIIRTGPAAGFRKCSRLFNTHMTVPVQISANAARKTHRV